MTVDGGYKASFRGVMKLIKIDGGHGCTTP